MWFIGVLMLVLLALIILGIDGLESAIKELTKVIKEKQ